MKLDVSMPVVLKRGVRRLWQYTTGAKAFSTIEMMYLRIAIAPFRPKIEHAGLSREARRAPGRQIQILLAAGVPAMSTFTDSRDGAVGLPVPNTATLTVPVTNSIDVVAGDVRLRVRLVVYKDQGSTAS